jgi:hypothetical protein
VTIGTEIKCYVACDAHMDAGIVDTPIYNRWSFTNYYMGVVAKIVLYQTEILK